MNFLQKTFLIIISIILTISVFVQANIGFSAEQSEIDMVINKINELDPEFIPNIIEAGAEVDKIDGTKFYTSELVTKYFNDLIEETIDDARADNDITYENYRDKLKDYFGINILASQLYNLIEFAYGDLKKQYEETNATPKALQPMANAFAETIEQILGLEPTPTPEPTTTPTPTPKKSSSSGGSSTTVVISTATPTPTPAPTSVPTQMPVVAPNFNDVQNHIWAKEAIDTLYSIGVVNGISDNAFAPSENVTREQFVKMLAELIKLDLSNPTSTFNDVSEDSWFYPYVAKMVSEGYLKGISLTQFGVGYNITREDMAVLMFRIHEKFEHGTVDMNSAEAFSDEANISDYAKNAVKSLRALNIINGTPDNYFNPKNSATRAEAVQMLYNFYKVMKNII